jgi:maltooligosyltrehalose trehalohydrolase
MEPEREGYFIATIDDIADGARYSYVLETDGGTLDLPDPSSRHQPDGVHGPSAVVSSGFPWSDHGWRAPRMRDLILYELHVGTFTERATFDAAASQLARLRGLGINAIELLPIAQFPGARNWGYDGVFPFAAQNSYGGPAALKRLVDAAHGQGIAVILDVVYNHVGPEGNYLPRFGPYFTDRYRTPWGDALNYDGADSDEVRAFFIQSALQWIDEFHIDGLRVDAVHAIVDASARPFLAELTDSIRDRERRLARHTLLIAESDLADPRVITATERGGLGFDAQWLDDFHHAVHALLTGETVGYYEDFGELSHLDRAFRQAFVYGGEYSRVRRRRHGVPAAAATPDQFVVCAQNHDQIGNRRDGDRLTTLVSFDALKLAAACTLLSPYIPMLFMGEEYGAEAPFPYFVSHSDESLIDAVRKGRHSEFAGFGWNSEPPDPQSDATFQSAALEDRPPDTRRAHALMALYRDLVALRSEMPLLLDYASLHTDVDDAAAVLTVRRTARSLAQGERGPTDLLLVLNFGERAAQVPAAEGWELVISTHAPPYADAEGSTTASGGTGAASHTVAPLGAALFARGNA